MRLKIATSVSMMILGLALAACAPEDNSAEGIPSDPGPVNNKVSDDFSRQNMVITAACRPSTPGGADVDVDGWDAQSWRHVAHAFFRLPDSVPTSSFDDHANVLAMLCNSGSRPPTASETSLIRSLFDRSFTKIAVTILDPETRDTTVGYVSRDGQLTDLSGDLGFGGESERYPALAPDGSTLWAIKGARLLSRPTSEGGQPVDHPLGEFDSPDTIIMVGSKPYVVQANGAHLSPDGRRIQVDVYSDLDSDNLIVDVPSQGSVVPQREVVNNRVQEIGIPVDGCESDAIGWIDDSKLLCGGPGGDDRFFVVDVSADSTPGPKILPESGNENTGMIISPDGKRFAFASSKEDSLRYYTCDTNPNSTPVQIQETGDFATLGDNIVFIDWR
ncbi:hypothetical protein ACGFI4_25435 [Micromonospora carbonacea]|uniref:hypothetical protein n=1 Tax=Micromonospora carbonacea TaxID=47853 RepID=UPI00371FC0EC